MPCLAAVLAVALTLAGPRPGAAATAQLIFEQVATRAGAMLGIDLGQAGDLNADGWPDFVVGAPGADGSTSGSGAVYVYFGGPGLDATPDLVLAGEASYDQFGTSACGLGDVDGDGYDDLLVGAPFHDTGGLNAGRAYVYFGGPGLDATADLVLDGAEGEQFGWSVAGPGDLDGGGPDLVVGAPGAVSFAGRAYVFSGGVALDDSVDVVIEGSEGTRFGWSTSRAGDWNADGWQDLLVGANTDRYTYLFPGGTGFDGLDFHAFVAEGWGDRIGYGLGAAGDFNGDGYDDIVIGAIHNDAGGTDAGRAYLHYGGPEADLVPDLVFTGYDDYGLLGRSADGSGDLNNDGYGDLVIGAPTPDWGAFGAGSAHVYFGGDPSSSAPPDTTADLVLFGEFNFDRMGVHVAIVPDMDGDGRDDFLVGANLFDGPGAVDGGKFYLYAIPNTAPVAVADSVTLPAAGPFAIDVLANDSDPDGQLVPASVTVVAPPLHGQAEVDTLTGAIVYTPDPSFAGLDSLAYTVSDHEGAVSLPAVVLITVPDTAAPAALELLAATGGAGAVTVSWQGVPADADSLEIWRAAWRDGDGQSAYPLYDDAPGSAPPVRPLDRAAALADTAWTLVARLAAGEAAYVDSVAARGVWHYEIFARDTAGNYGPPTEEAPRTLNYVLGDFADDGDGVVDTSDVAVLLAEYGTRREEAGFAAAVDIGPTDDGTGTGIPLTDGAVDFEDVMILALNHGTPSAPASAGGEVQLAWRRPAPEVWVLDLEEAHASLKGLRVSLAVPAGVEAQVAAGWLASAQAAPVFTANAEADTVDAALVVLGGGAALTGAGQLLVITLSAPAELAQPQVTARATDNTELSTSFAQVSGVPGVPVAAFELEQNSPNPFNPQTTIRFALPAAGRARLVVHDVRGRAVATLVDAELPAGAHTVVWDGRDGRGAPAGSGVYLYRLEAQGSVTSRRMTLLK